MSSGFQLGSLGTIDTLPAGGQDLMKPVQCTTTYCGSPSFGGPSPFLHEERCSSLASEMCLYRERDALPVSASQEVESVYGHRLYRTHSTSGHRHNNAARTIFHSIVYIENTIEDFW